ncbi:hypothetical protein DAMA08_006600 [Martiniozyma asiatica (nom. inval.)]|nr:hypothetical protein DAMA08_006600 [Martiniozyma asiatica]
MYSHTEVPFSVDLDAALVNRISLPVNVHQAIKEHPLSSVDLVPFDDDLSSLTSSFGGFFNLSGSRPFNTISYAISGSTGNIITISPVHLTDDVRWDYHVLAFKLPASVYFNCISFTQVDNSIILDVLLVNNVLVTLAFGVDAFTQNCSLSPSDIYHKWCKYSLVFSFDHRKPLSMKALNPLNLIVPLADGGLLHLSREDIFSEYMVNTFTSTSYVSSFKFLNLFSGSGATSNIPQNAEFNGESISTKAILDVVPFSNDLFITISIDKRLSWWSISSQKIIKEINMNSYLPESLSSAILSPYLPKTILSIVGQTLTIFMPIEKHFLYIFDISNGSDMQLINVINPPIPNSSWLPLDYTVTNIKGILEFWFAWYFGESTLYQYATVDNNGVACWTTTISKSKIEEMEIQKFINDVNGSTDIEYLRRHAMRFIKTKYNNGVLVESIKLFNSHYDIDISNLSLDDQIEKILSNEGLESYQKQLLRFTSVCQDIQVKSSDRILSISSIQNEHNKFVYALKTKCMAVIKKSSPFEFLLFNSVSGNENANANANTSLNIHTDYFDDVDTNVDFESLFKLVKLITDFGMGFPNQTKQDISNLLVEGFGKDDVKNIMEKIFQTQIVKVVNESTANELLGQLSKIPKAITLINYLVNLLTANPTDYKPIDGIFVTNRGQLFIDSMIYNSGFSAQKILFDLALVLLTIDISDPIVQMFKVTHKNLENISVINDIHHLPKFSYINKYLKHQYDGGVSINSKNINQVLSNYFANLCSEEFKLYFISQLLSENASNVAYEFWTHFPQTAIGHIISGFTLMKIGKSLESKDLFTLYADEITQTQLTSCEHNAISSIFETISLILVPSKIDYFYNLAILFEKNHFDNVALFFSLESFKLISEIDQFSSTTTSSDILYKIFNISLRLEEYDSAFEAISNMRHLDKVGPIKLFVYKLFQESKLNKLLYFKFDKDYQVVDDLIWEMGEAAIGVIQKSSDVNSTTNIISVDGNAGELINVSSSFDLDLALKYYRICYSLRYKNGDVRGAAEALYRFNTVILSRNLKIESASFGELELTSELKLVMDNYLIIFNILNTIPQEERWLVKKSVNAGRNKLIQWKELSIEMDKLKILLGME